MKTRLSKEEKEILESFEKGEWTPVENLSERKKALAEYARNTLKKDKRVNIRISERDLIELQRKAVQEGLPYQTYLSSIIHKFVSGNMPLIGFAKAVPGFSARAGLRAAASKTVPAKSKAQKAATKRKKK